MKTEYTNAEKVSSNFIEIRCSEMLQRYGEFIYGLFKEKIEAIKSSDEDNYEKLKRLIHLDNEIEEYMASKKVIFDIVFFEFEKEQDKFISATGSFKVSLTECTYVALVMGKKYWEEQVSQEQKIEFCGYLSKKYLNDMPTNKIIVVINSLDDEDREKLKAMIEKFYADYFATQIIQPKVRDVEIGTFFNQSEDGAITELSQNSLLFIARAFIKAYFDIFHFEEEDALANEFKRMVQKATSISEIFFKLIQKNEFWYLLLNFDVFHHKLRENSVLNVSNPNSGTSTKLPTLIKVALEELPQIASSKLFLNMDFRGLDLTEVDFTGATFQNCNLEGTNAKLNFEGINQNESVYYVRGQKIERSNFINSCFKGCSITGLTDERLSTCIFSIDTFDEEILKNHGFWVEDIDRGILDKYYKSEPLTIYEASLLLSRGFNVNLRYLNIISERSYKWVQIYSQLFPKNASKLLEVVNES